MRKQTITKLRRLDREFYISTNYNAIILVVFNYSRTPRLGIFAARKNLLT